MVQDLRYAIRMFLRRPGFTAVVVLTLALGIGANAALFSVIYAVLLKSLPFGAPERLVSIGETNPGWSTTLVSGAAFFEWRKRTDCFDRMAVAVWWDVNLESCSEPQVARSSFVTRDYFDVLGVAPMLGRTFVDVEHARGGPKVVVLGHSLWQRLGGRTDLVGSSIRIDGDSYTVVGVMPPILYNGPFIGWTDLWAPSLLDESVAKRPARRWRGHRALARLKSGVGIEQARAQLETVQKQLAAEDPLTYGSYGVAVTSLHQFVTGGVRTALLMLLAAVATVLLIACVNIANLLLARAAAREKEIAIRIAEGASRVRLIRQMLTENVLLSLAGASCGLVLAQALLYAIVRMSPPDLPGIRDASIDWRVLLFTLTLASAAGVVFGLMPALAASRASVAEVLRSGSRSTAGSRMRERLKSALVVAEVALAMLLLATAGLLGRSFIAVLSNDAGFARDGAATFELMLPGARYRDTQRGAFFRELLRRLESLPGVVAAGANRYFPLHERQYSNPIFIEGRPVPDGQEPVVQYAGITSGYLKAMSIPLRAGRVFSEEEMWERRGAVMINESMARRLWPGENPIGKRIKGSTEGPWETIVGIVGDVKQRGLDQKAYPQLYTAYSNFPHNIMSFAVRTNGDPANLLGAIRREVQSLDPSLPVGRLMTLDNAVRRTVLGRRMALLLFAFFAALALALTAVGLYGVISYVVAQRTNEIGIRMALGARAGNVMSMVMRYGLGLAGIGLLAGTAGSIAVGRFVATLLYGVSPMDPLTYACVSSVLLVIAAAASYLPARRATQVDPLLALRQEQ